MLILGIVEVERGQLLKAGTYGLSREFRLVGVLACPARVVAWPAVETIVTRWRRPDDYTVLETIVSGGGTSICRLRFSRCRGPRRQGSALPSFGLPC